MHLTETAYAKINLALHVRARREDGYHEIETLFAFIDVGDELWVEPAKRFLLEVGGLFGDLESDDSNIVTRAARLVHRGKLPDLRIDLAKYLPIAAGLGGGSADAAATLRLLGAVDRLDLAAALGADVPACMASVPIIGTGTGTDLHPVENDVAGLACVLANPHVPLATSPVYAGWDGIDRGPMPQGTAREIMLAGRNDLEASAIALCPEVAELLDYLHNTDPLLARMSGSGASCYAIYESYERAYEVSFKLREYDHQEWWSWEGRLR